MFLAAAGTAAYDPDSRSLLGLLTIACTHKCSNLSDVSTMASLFLEYPVDNVNTQHGHPAKPKRLQLKGCRGCTSPAAKNAASSQTCVIAGLRNAETPARKPTTRHCWSDMGHLLRLRWLQGRMLFYLNKCVDIVWLG